jgi:hypothetical protein
MLMLWGSVSWLFASGAEAWWQVFVGLVSAIATIIAVVVAIRSANSSIRVAQEISLREANERRDRRYAHAKALAAAFTEEIWENGARAYTIFNFAKTYPADMKLAEYLVGLEGQMQAPILEGAISHMEVFDPEDAQLFSRCAARICQLRRDSLGQQRNLLLGIVEPTIRNIEDASRNTPALLEQGLERAHAISGVERTKSPMRIAGGVPEEDRVTR